MQDYNDYDKNEGVDKEDGLDLSAGEMIMRTGWTCQHLSGPDRNVPCEMLTGTALARYHIPQMGSAATVYLARLLIRGLNKKRAAACRQALGGVCIKILICLSKNREWGHFMTTPTTASVSVITAQQY